MKFRDCACSNLGPGKADEAIVLIDRLDELSAVRQLVEVLA